MAIVSNSPIETIIKDLEKFKDYKHGKKAEGEKFEFPFE